MCRRGFTLSSACGYSPNRYWSARQSDLALITPSENSTVSTPKLAAIAAIASVALLTGGLASAPASASTHTAASKSIPAGADPDNTFLGPNGKDLWLINYDPASASEIDLATKKVIKSFDLIEFPRWSMLSPNGTQLWVTNEADDVVTVYSVSSGLATHTIPVGDFPVDFAFNHSGSQVWVTNDDSDTISVIDTSTYAVVETIPLPTPWTIVFNKSGSKAYASTEGRPDDSDTVAVIDTSTYTVDGSLAGISGSFTYSLRSPDGSRLYFVNDANPGSLEAYSLTDKKVLKLITVGDDPWFATVNADGSRIYVPNSDGDTVSVVNANSLKVTSTLSTGTGTGPWFVTFSKSGKSIYLTEQGAEKILILPASHTVSATVLFGGPNPVLNSGNRSILKALKARIPKDAKYVSVHIVGYTNADASENLDLARAGAAEAYLKSLGLSATYSVASGGVKHREAVVTVTYTP
jgi:YVTN family beta-propeller protein